MQQLNIIDAKIFNLHNVNEMIYLPLQYVREKIYQCAPFIGFPKTLNAISVFNEVIKERGLEKELKNTKNTIENDRYQKGYAIQNPMYGDEIVQNMKGLPNGADVAR